MSLPQRDAPVLGFVRRDQQMPEIQGLWYVYQWPSHSITLGASANAQIIKLQNSDGSQTQLWGVFNYDTNGNLIVAGSGVWRILHYAADGTTELEGWYNTDNDTSANNPAFTPLSNFVNASGSQALSAFLANKSVQFEKEDVDYQSSFDTEFHGGDGGNDYFVLGIANSPPTSQNAKPPNWGGNDTVYLGSAGSSLDPLAARKTLDYSRWDAKAANQDNLGWNNAGGLTIDLPNGDVEHGRGEDIIYGALSADVDVVGSNFGDEIIASGGKNFIVGGSGNDTVEGYGGFDDIDGGGGFNTLDYSWFGGTRIQDQLALTTRKLRIDLSYGEFQEYGGTYSGRVYYSQQDAVGDPPVDSFDAVVNFQKVIGGQLDNYIIGPGGGDNVVLDGGRAQGAINTISSENRNGYGGSTIIDGGIQKTGAQNINTVDYHWDAGPVVIDLRNMGFGAAARHSGGTDTLANIRNVISGSGDDTIYMGGLGSFIDGGGGSNKAVFAGKRADYNFSLTGQSFAGQYTDFYADGVTSYGTFSDWVRAARGNGIDELRNIQYFQFSDGTYTLAQLLSSPPADNGNSANHTSSDLDADGHSDIAFRRTSDGLAYLFTMNDATVTNGATLSTQVGNNWQIKGIGDFDGNGTSDLLFVYNNAANPSDGLNGISYITLQNGPAATSGSNVVQQLGPEWSVQGVGDFDGDGKSDVLYRRSTDGALYLDAMNGASIDFSKSGFMSQQISDPHWQVAGIGDFDGDGHADILWRYDNPSNLSDGLNGVVYEWLMNGTNVTGQGLISSQPGSDKWQVAGTGDFDGNGTADILFRYGNTANAGDALNGFTYLDLMNGTNVSSASAPTQWQVDNSWSVASIGDYNGDGKSDILFQHAGDGATYIWDMNGTATTSGNFTSMQSGPGWAVQNGVLIG